MLDRSPFNKDDTAHKERHTPLRHKRERQKLVVRTRDGAVLYGMCFSLNRDAPAFHLELLDKHGKSLDRTKHIHFDTLKAVFYVKSFDGKFNAEEYASTIKPDGKAVAVEFYDGEVLVGRPIHTHWKDEARFYIMPEKDDSNNLMVLIERSAIKSVHDAHSYEKRKEAEFRIFSEKHLKPGMSQEECLGDYYFWKHDYKNAWRQYRLVREQHGESERLKKKMVITRYNLAIRCIKQKDYARALRLMESVLAIAPHHEQAREKAQRLREHIANRGSDSSHP